MTHTYAILEVSEDAYDEIRANLVDLFEKLDPMTLAGDLEKAMTLGELAGRATVEPKA